MRRGLILAVSVCALACESPVGVSRVPARQVHRSLTANVLTTSRPSAHSTQVLHRLDLFDRYRRDPDAALRSLRRAMLASLSDADLLFALAELEFQRGQSLRRSPSRPHFMAAAFYAHHFLRVAVVGGSRSALDPRLRLASDLYNRGLTAGLASDDGEYVDLSPRRMPLPFGRLVLEADPAELEWAGYRMTDFVPVAELAVRGLRNRYRRHGVGAPLAASLVPAKGTPPPGSAHISGLVRVPATAIVQFEGGDEALDRDQVSGRISIFTLDDTTTVTVGTRELPLEFEPTAALAFGLTEERPWEFERKGFFMGDFRGAADRGVRMLSPYDPERIPVVFIHGTASSPWRWAEMINHLQSQSALLSGYQFWLFQYNTGNPIPFSAGLLREGLRELVAELDPEGDDDNLKRMILVGHSQGGLLAKLCVVESGDVFWRELVSQAAIEELDLEPENRELLERSIFFDPLPFVGSVVFVATPHRGSFLAERWYVQLVAGMVSIPRDLADAFGDVVISDDDRVLLRSLDEMPSSVDQMTRDNAFLKLLAEMPIAPGVEAHSIIAVSHDNKDPALAHDGVVTVESQRLSGVRSEFIVRSGHSTQRHPITITEVARILKEVRREAGTEASSESAP